MTSAKVLFLTLTFLLLSSPCFAQDDTSVKVGATAQFSYVQMIGTATGYLAASMNITGKVPYEIQIVSNERVMIIH